MILVVFLITHSLLDSFLFYKVFLFTHFKVFLVILFSYVFHSVKVLSRFPQGYFHLYLHIAHSHTTLFTLLILFDNRSASVFVQTSFFIAFSSLVLSTIHFGLFVSKKVLYLFTFTIQLPHNVLHLVEIGRSEKGLKGNPFLRKCTSAEPFHFYHYFTTYIINLKIGPLNSFWSIITDFIHFFLATDYILNFVF